MNSHTQKSPRGKSYKTLVLNGENLLIQCFGVSSSVKQQAVALGKYAVIPGILNLHSNLKYFIKIAGNITY